MDSPFLGMIQYFAFDFAPKGYQLCAGQLMPINQYAAIFALLGTNYGGNGTTNFALPDLRGRSTQGWGNMNSLGERSGAENATLLTVNMPVHTHSAAPKIAANNVTTVANTNNPQNNFPSGVHLTRGSGLMYTATPDANTYLGGATFVVAPTGNSQPFSTLNPYLAVTACIAISGLFPSRN